MRGLCVRLFYFSCHTKSDVVTRHYQHFVSFLDWAPQEAQ